MVWRITQDVTALVAFGAPVAAHGVTLADCGRPKDLLDVAALEQLRAR